MLPRRAINNITNTAMRDSELTSNGASSYSEAFKQTHLHDLFIIQFGVLFCLASWWSHTSFFKSILRIVLVGAQKQMLGIATRAIVAFVADAQALRNWTICKLESNSVSGRVLASYFVFPISGDFVNATRPFPTPVITSNNVCPESFFERLLPCPSYSSASQSPFYSLCVRFNFHRNHLSLLPPWLQV